MTEREAGLDFVAAAIDELEPLELRQHFIESGCGCRHRLNDARQHGRRELAADHRSELKNFLARFRLTIDTRGNQSLYGCRDLVVADRTRQQRRRVADSSVAGLSTCQAAAIEQ